MARTLIAVADTVFPTLEPARRALAALDPEIVIARDKTPGAILEVAAEADALLVTYSQIKQEVISGLKKCRAIGRFGIGIDNIDIPAAAAAGITVTYAPVYCLEEVSDHTMALLISLARKIPFSDKLVKSGRWEMPAVVPISRFRGSTLGLVGLGNIPQRVVPKAQGFGIEVIAADPYCPDEVFRDLNVRKVSLDELLTQSDYVSVHAPLTEETRNMFSTEAFGKMKNSAILINTARGPLVDVVALDAALEAGEIAGAALDVLPQEPPPADLKIAKRDNVVLTPHTAFYSEQALLDLQTTVAADVAAVLSGEQPKYPVRLPK